MHKVTGKDDCTPAFANVKTLVCDLYNPGDEELSLKFCKHRGDPLEPRDEREYGEAPADHPDAHTLVIPTP